MLIPLRLTLLAVFSVVLAGCGVDAPQRMTADGGRGAPDGAAEQEDAGSAADGGELREPDAAVGGDGGESDAGPPDAGGSDAGYDAGVVWPTGPGCSVAGEAGVCVDTEMCPGQSTPGFCSGPSNIQCCTPFRWGCDPDAYPQPNAGLSEAPGGGGCPDGMVGVGTFCVDRYEASLLRVRSDGTTEPWSPYRNPAGQRVLAVSIPGAVPQGYISQVEASAACREAGKRLCTDEEWLRACQGAAGQTYPYGNARQPGVCADATSEHPAARYFGTTADWIYAELDNACINQVPDSLSRSGDHPMCESPDGPIDMMGNLHEWTANAGGVFRGGFYADTRRNGEGCLYRTTAHAPAYWDYSTGFRCCAGADP